MSTESDPDFVARPQLSDDVARYVRRRIFNGTYGAGEYLRLDQLAVELGISVTPVREALLNLRAEGLLVQQPRRGFMVLPVTARDIADVANVQAFIGGELAARAAENISDEQLAALRAIQDDLERAYEQDDLERTVRLNHEFHRTINVAADSPKLTQFMSGITRYAPESVFPTLAGWPRQSMKDHRRVIAAFENRDATRARMAMAEHFTIGVAPLTDHLIERGVIADGESAAKAAGS
ncbi:GntR family transcriptional regulator [Mycobacterium sp. URHB0044]|jgi:DNA-binding GntR family transcriptional regulator|uniref:GntR family transcriptional regulator n=1 Tax=Mycobacterium sp. URHB0044 TaxID=1380386 RepID=UPI000491C60C|nr:GntR family transcriptional regulator [Mycobacterium sp. URHB0044]